MKAMKPKELDKLVTLRECQAACEKRNLATYGSIEMLKNRLREDDGTGKKKPGPKPGAPRKAAEQKADDDQKAVHIHLPTKLDAATMKTLQYKFVREEVGAPLPFVYKKTGDKEVASPSPKALGTARALVFPHKSKELYGKAEQTKMKIVLDSFDKTAEFPYTWVKATDSSSPAATKKRVLGDATETSKKQKTTPAGSSKKQKTTPAGSPKQKTTPAAAPNASAKTGSYVTPTLFSSKYQTQNGIQLEERSSGMCIYSVVDETKFKREKLDRFAEADDIDDDDDAGKKGEDDDDDDMRWPNEVLHGRLMKVSNHPEFRQWVCQGLDMFKVDYSEKDSKRNLATMLTEQVHYETDDNGEDDDDEDEDDDDDDDDDNSDRD